MRHGQTVSEGKLYDIDMTEFCLASGSLRHLIPFGI